MGLRNTLNIGELLKRIGVDGDSQGSADLLESLRMGVQVADLSDLVPPLGVPIGGAQISSSSGGATFNKFSLHCRSPGGLILRSVTMISAANAMDFFVTNTPVFGAALTSTAHNYGFGQAVLSTFDTHTPGAKVAPAGTPTFFNNRQPSFGYQLFNWVGPGEFFNFEANSANVTDTLSIIWTEFPAGLNP